MSATEARFPAQAPSAVARRGGRPKLGSIIWLLMRPGGHGSPAAALLPVIAFCVTTALTIVVIGGTLMFWSWTGETAASYQVFSLVAAALLVVPLGTLAASAARLSARRNDQQLSTLRLLGATTPTVVFVSTVQATALAAIGAVAGVALAGALMPLVGLLPFGGGPIGTWAAWPGFGVAFGCAAGVVVLAAASSLAGLRRVVISPLGVRMRSRGENVRKRRVWIALAVILLALAVNATAQAWGPAVQSVVGVATVLGAMFGGGLAVLGVIGPWLLATWSRRKVRSATIAPAALIAHRSILESPTQAWRQVGGMALVSFVAVVAGAGLSVISSVDQSAVDPAAAVMLADMRTGVFLTLGIAFAMVACSIAVTQAAAVLDRADLYRALDALGTPRIVMEHARSLTVFGPLRFVVFFSAGVGAVLTFPLIGAAAVMNPVALATVAAVFALGFTLVWVAQLATRPLLTAVLRER